MTSTEPLGRRERNKQDKLDRIRTAAAGLFAERGVDDVTTQEIAERADIGAGTLFLYARNKGELLLLVQNGTYAEALERGRARAASTPDTLDAVMAVVGEVVACNRSQVSNGRTYLREMVFGDPAEPHHRDALALAARTEQVIADILGRSNDGDDRDAAALAHVVSAVMFMAMAVTANVDSGVRDIVDQIRPQIRALLPAPSRKAPTA